jgi:hypothetical protein
MSMWARATGRATAERLADVLDLNSASTMTTLAGARPPRQVNHRPPPEDLRQHINEGRDMWSVISSKRKVREEVETEGTDCSDRFPAFSACFSSYKYPEGFKPIGITKYDGKQAPQ